MIDHVKNSKPAAKNKSKVKSPLFDESNLTYDPELDKLSGEEYIPEKHEEDEIRLSKSVLPPRSSSFK